MATSILICEPQCRGYEHALFNAALTETVRLAWPEDRVEFWGEKEHLACVRGYLSEEAHIGWHELSVPQRTRKGWRRLGSEGRWCRRILAQAKSQQARALVFCSLTREGLFVLKRFMRRGGANCPVLAVLHSLLVSLIQPESRRPMERLLSLRRMLHTRHPPFLRYLVLGDSIYREVAETAPKVSGQFSSLDIPYFWSVTGLPPEPEIPKPVRFGYFGSGYKGMEGFYRLAEQFGPSDSFSDTNAEFAMVGYLRDAALRRKYEQKILDVSSSPLSADDYFERGSRLTYALWAADPEHYRLTASASYLDAFSFIKPGIVLRNPFVEHYFEKMGDIGYLCDSIEEMAEVIRGIGRQFPTERYYRQCQNILDGRWRFEPSYLAGRLRKIIQETSG